MIWCIWQVITFTLIGTDLDIFKLFASDSLLSVKYTVLNSLRYQHDIIVWINKIDFYSCIRNDFTTSILGLSHHIVKMSMSSYGPWLIKCILPQWHHIKIITGWELQCFDLTERKIGLNSCFLFSVLGEVQRKSMRKLNTQ